MREHSETEFKLVEGARSAMIEGLNARTIDLTVLIGPPDTLLGDALPLWLEQAYAVMPITHELAGEAQVSWERLVRETLIFSTRDAGPDAESALIARLGGPGPRPKRCLHTINRDTLLSLVAMGRGIALMIESDLGLVPSGVVLVPLIDESGPTRELLTAYRDPGNDNPALRRFWSLLKSRYSEFA
jgi:DNA-binding transcriptional LysR family regulator